MSLLFSDKYLLINLMQSITFLCLVLKLKYTTKLCSPFKCLPSRKVLHVKTFIYPQIYSINKFLLEFQHRLDTRDRILYQNNKLSLLNLQFNVINLRFFCLFACFLWCDKYVHCQHKNVVGTYASRKLVHKYWRVQGHYLNSMSPFFLSPLADMVILFP